MSTQTPKSLYAPTQFLSREACKALFDKVVGMTTGGGTTTITITSAWNGESRWARSRMHVSSDTHEFRIEIGRPGGHASTTRMDDEGLLQAIHDAEETVVLGTPGPEHIVDPRIDEPMLQPVLWSDATYNFTPEARTALVEELMAPADAAGLLTAGKLRMSATGSAYLSTDGTFHYYPTTEVSCSITVRDPKGTASGWAGVNHYALEKIEPKAIAARALDKCQRMAKPSAVEPGRYTVILESQAVADLFSALLGDPMDRPNAEKPSGPFGGKETGRSKINEQVLDRRFTMRSDPMDPDGGFVPFDPWRGNTYNPVTWIDQGILKELAYNRGYALATLNRSNHFEQSYSYRLTPAPGVPTSTIDEMIAKTQRGILVTRLSGVGVVDGDSLLCTGYTRDGIWLIENGKISKPVKNFRFTESPLFVLNKLLDVGVSQRVYSEGGGAWVVPPVRVDDFSFTSLADAV